ncbi:hypothetical protein DPMN_137157 [Dreissena polymorpha]|uniref:Uncharacterized protein n=1 Tax=Dreissena polymorpha TaxID=45954 RepID=A0A9D4G4Z8_DREPO|nr:hypothetical protein DPMN_137157 [Dreissena polymorpha]
MGPGVALVPSRLFLVSRRSLPVLPGYFRFIPDVLTILIISRWSPRGPRSSPVHPGRPCWSPGRAPVHPGRSQITHRGSTGIIVILGF